MKGPADTVFSSSESFLVVSYYSSHGLLLLKGARKSKPNRETHILFQDVRAHELRMLMKGLVITKRDTAFLEQFASKPIAVFESENEIYEIKSDDWMGYVVAGRFRAEEYPFGPMYESPLMGEAPNIFLGREMRK